MIINRDNFYLPNKLGVPKKEREIDLKKIFLATLVTVSVLVLGACGKGTSSEKKPTINLPLQLQLRF